MCVFLNELPPVVFDIFLWSSDMVGLPRLCYAEVIYEKTRNHAITENNKDDCVWLP